MADQGESTGVTRKPRADAGRNRLRLMEAAKAAFTELGPDVALDEIARRAGVGIGTLYRHFPTRDVLLADVYRHAVEQLADTATRLSKTEAPVDALRDWMRLFGDYFATKQVIAPALTSMAGARPDLYASSGETIKSAMSLLINRAVAHGDIRMDLDPFDFLRALVGVANVNNGPDWQRRAHALIDILIEGVRVRPSHATSAP